ncbi:glycosyltransferase [Stella sp.]|uniref:glycosyltransferase n=1 Tax=Stella sp. TaxID=2912054 RepID=UPI0035ADCAF9
MFTTRFSEAEIRQAVDACRSGRHPSEVGRELGVSERTVLRWRRRLAADAGEAEPVAMPSRATALLPRPRLFAALGDVALLWAPLPEPVAMADAKMRWGGEPVPEPLVFSIVGDPEQGWHLLVLGRVPGGLSPGATAPAIEIRAADAALLVAAPAAPIEPLVPAAGPILPRLPDIVRHRALRVLAETGGTFLKLHEDPSFAALCRALALGVAGRPAGWSEALSLGGRLHYCVGQSPADPGDVRGVLLIGSRGVRRNPFLPQPRGERGGAGGRLQLVVDRAEGLGPGRVLVLMIGFGRPTLFVLEPDAVVPATGLHRHLQERPDEAPAARHYLLRCLRPYLRASHGLRALLRESLALVPDALPASAAGRSLSGEIDLAVASADGGLFVRGWLHDPQEVVAELELVSAFDETRAIAPGTCAFARSGADGRRLAGDGFVAHFPALQPVMPDAPVRLRARLASGALVELPAAPVLADPERVRQELLGAVPAGAADDVLLERCLAPALADAVRDLADEAGAPTVDQLGPCRGAVDWSIVVPLYRSLELLPAQFAAFAADPDMARSELVLVLDSPEQQEDLRRALHGLDLVYGLPVTLVVNRRNLGYAGAVNAGARAARGRWLVPCNSDVLPQRPGWLSALRRSLLPGIGAAGPLLLFPDDTIQHAGLYYDRGADGQWLNRHFLKGMPRGAPGAVQPREVPGITGACLMLAAETFARLGGFSTDYVIGDYEDSDLCLRLRELGLRLWYAPEAVLYHLERHSIQQHAGYQRGLASRHNRWLHGRRWGERMARLMDDPTRWGLPRQGDWRRRPAAAPPEPGPAAVPLVA